MVEFKEDDEIIWDKTVKLTQKDWDSCGKLNDYVKNLNTLIERYGEITVIRTSGPDVQLKDDYYYPKKLFKLPNNTIEIW